LENKQSYGIPKWEIDSHSSVLHNETMHEILILIHNSAISFEGNPNFSDLCKYYAGIRQLWLYVRQIITSRKLLQYIEEMFDDAIKKKVAVQRKIWLKELIFLDDMLEIEEIMNSILDMIIKVLQKGSRYFFRTSQFVYGDKMIVDYLRNQGISVAALENDEVAADIIGGINESNAVPEEKAEEKEK